MQVNSRVRRLRRYQFTVAATILVISACGGSVVLDSEAGEQENIAEIDRRVDPIDIEFPGATSDEEARLLEEIALRQELVVAMRSKPGVYSPGAETPAFQHRLILKLGSLLEVGVRVVPVDSIGAYFATDTDVLIADESNSRYVPDGGILPIDVDIYADIITILPAREAIVRFVPTIPVRQLLLFPASASIDSISDLRNLRIAMVEGSSYESMIESISTQAGFEPTYVHVMTTSEMVPAVAEGRADVTLQDSILGIEIVRSHRSLVLGRPLGELQLLGWAIARENDALAGLLRRFIRYVRETGVWEQYWRDAFGIGYLEYLELIGI